MLDQNRPLPGNTISSNYVGFSGNIDVRSQFITTSTWSVWFGKGYQDPKQPKRVVFGHGLWYESGGDRKPLAATRIYRDSEGS
jgi:hypothetical protein